MQENWACTARFVCGSPDLRWVHLRDDMIGEEVERFGVVFGHAHRQLTQAVATQWHLAISGTFAGQGHHQRTCRRGECFRSTTARSILQPITALSDKSTKPSADSGSAHPLLARQRATAQPSGLDNIPTGWYVV